MVNIHFKFKCSNRFQFSRLHSEASHAENKSSGESSSNANSSQSNDPMVSNHTLLTIQSFTILKFCFPATTTFDATTTTRTCS